ncbi:MAG: acyltransferase [Candidatus Eisenbacteria bacterium]|nr:acyltransferase [Candidatus Eisenbacteria bacterium]
MKAALRSFVRRLFRVPEGISLSFWWMNWYGKRILRINAGVPWPVHFTSTIHHPERIRYGAGPHCPGDSPNTYIQAYNGIEIGDDVNMAPGVGLISANHDPLDNSRHLPAPPIRIGNRCWIGMNAVILPGVELGENVIVGAGAVVTKSFPGHVILGGNPARVLKESARPERGEGTR